MLVDCCVPGLCAGACGKSWAKVEALCAGSERRLMGLRFGESGHPRQLLDAGRACDSNGYPVIASGGLRNDVDLRALALEAVVGAPYRE